MISFDFDYYKPSSVGEAVHLYQQLSRQGKQPLYYSGGTEIITLGRMNMIYTGAVIDIKGIPECRVVAAGNGMLTIGAALTLSELYDSGLFPLLGEAADGVADRTSRNKITLGGNICGRFMYREAVLPLLLTDSYLEIAGLYGIRRVLIHQVFNQTLRLEPGELLVKATIDEAYTRMPYVVVKRRQQAAVDYPLVTLAALKTASGIRVAFSGVCAFPFRSKVVEDTINNKLLPVPSRIEQAVNQLPAPVISDIKGSTEYRIWVLKNTLLDTVERLGGTSELANSR